ncbi:hypothetical protein AVEN_206663-1 [Araneus ventricosus]|uniref:Uncharacterized protein n=1 Tax=Araneus ventricosus TaxID=182803 RepID=A0A4Y2X6P4_ARAVE|nr:hypothetical protein AVEN_206663-1 [Araneus ventricosus]
MCKSGTGYFENPNHGHRKFKIVVVVSYSTCSSPQIDQVQESPRPQKIQNYRLAIHGKGGSAASVGTRPWTPEGRSLTLSIAFMLLGIMEWPSRLG